MNIEALGHWYSVRVLVEITVGNEADSGSSDSFEDRLILVLAETTEEAVTKGAAFAEATNEQYLNGEGEFVRWTFRQVIEAHEVVDPILQDGTEIYSALINRELAEVLLRGGDSPLKAWMRHHQGSDAGKATVREVAEAWDARHATE